MHHHRFALYGIEHDLNDLPHETDQTDNLKSDQHEEEDDRGPIDESKSSKALSLPRGNSGNDEGFWFPRR